MSTRPWLIASLALCAVLGISLTGIARTMVSADDAAPADPAAETAAEDAAITILYTIKNAGYIEPCG